MSYKTPWMLAIPVLLWMMPSEIALADDVKVGDRVTLGGQPGTVTIHYGNTNCVQLDSGGTGCSTCQGDTCVVKGSKQTKPKRITITPLPTGGAAKSLSSSGGGSTPSKGGSNAQPALTNPSLLGGTGGAGSAPTAGSKAKLPASGTSPQAR